MRGGREGGGREGEEGGEREGEERGREGGREGGVGEERREERGRDVGCCRTNSLFAIICCVPCMGVMSLLSRPGSGPVTV